MAFGGVLLFNLILTWILTIAIAGALCLLAALILALIQLRRKRTGKPRKRWIPITAIVLLIVGILALLPLIALLLIG